MNKIIIAMDLTDVEKALEITKKIKNKILTVKLGLEYINSNGKNGIKKFNDIGVNNLMLDLKLNDIPQTVYKSIKALEGINFEYLTVHALGGNEMIRLAKKAAHELNPNIKILAVTILTSISKEELSKMGTNSTIEDMVIQLAKNSSEADGYVASALEVKLLKEKVSKKKLVFCPGIRMPNDLKNDQARTTTPSLAIQNKADAIIMGRSLLQGDINQNIEKVLNSIK